VSNYWQRIKSDPVKLGHHKEWRKPYSYEGYLFLVVNIGLLSLFLGCSEFISTGFQLIGPRLRKIILLLLAGALIILILLLRILTTRV
jgi:hypothetical protein